MRSGYRRGFPDEGSWIVGFVGSAGAGAVRVELSEPGAAARVQLLRGWRATAAERWGPVVLDAFAAALSARLHARVGAHPEFDFTATAALRALGTGREAAMLLADAARDLHEFVRRLATLHETPRVVPSTGGPVTATVRSGQIVALTIDAAWRDRADDTELALVLGEVLGAGLRLIADTPQQAMAGCPALAAVSQLAGGSPLAAAGALR
jgi:hypothetical protein